MKNIQLRTVLQTTDYDLFVMHEQNRVLVGPEGFKPRKDLVESMGRDGFLETGHIVCLFQYNGKLKIIDGHNRFVTAKHLGLPIWFTAHSIQCKATPLEHSKTIKSWAVRDFVSAHAQDSADYAEVMSFKNRTGIPESACFSLYAGMIGSSSSNIMSNMKSGDYKIKNRELPAAVAKIWNAIRPHCNFAPSSKLANAISRAFFAEGFSVERMIERINRKPELIKKCAQTADYEEMLENIYNHGVKSERLFLRAEIEKSMRKRNAAHKQKMT